MRKIEQQMLQAVRSGVSFNKDNTNVMRNVSANELYGLSCEVYLHGNHIASCALLSTASPSKQAELLADCDNTLSQYPCTSSKIAVKVNRQTLKAWPSVTTKSRLRALGVDLYQRKGKIYIGDEFICDAH